MKFELGDLICADGGEYRVVGIITYRNSNDGCCWDEYRILSEIDHSEHWLSVDDTYKEYSIWQKQREYINRDLYHWVDHGRERVISCSGSVDVEVGDEADFTEFEDETEELIISDEVWEDERECSTGYYLDEDEFWLIEHDAEYKKKIQRKTSGGGLGMVIGFIAIPLLLVFGEMFGSIASMFHVPSTIAKYLKKSSNYTYITSVTGNERQKANVYKAPDTYTIDQTARDIIYEIEGNTQYVQQDSDEAEGAIAILTKKEYCVVYPSVNGEVLVQVSNRKYAYTTDDDLYEGTDRSRRYYRSFYYSTGYGDDSTSYSSLSSPYSSYSGDSFTYSYDNGYSSYSSSVRQSSIDARQSSGGGLSGGK